MKIRELFEQEEEQIPYKVAEQLRMLTQGTINLNQMGMLYANSALDLSQSATAFGAFTNKVENGYELKYKLDVVLGNFDIHERQVASFKNFPNSVHGAVNCYNNNITSLEGAPYNISGSLDLIDNPITSFKDIDKYIQSCPKIYVPVSVQSNLLGVLKMKKIPLLSTASTDRKKEGYNTLLKAISIINEYGYNNKGSVNVLACANKLRIEKLLDYAQF
jgi:hypothetical protein